MNNLTYAICGLSCLGSIAAVVAFYWLSYSRVHPDQYWHVGMVLLSAVVSIPYAVLLIAAILKQQLLGSSLAFATAVINAGVAGFAYSHAFDVVHLEYLLVFLWTPSIQSVIALPAVLVAWFFRHRSTESPVT